jgi:pyruvate/2-oxoacid:ferredoxin oxidoreductase beta subunit
MDSDWYYRVERFESLRRDYEDADRAIRDCRQYTDRQLRELNKERKAISSELWHEYRFVAEADSFGSDTPPPRVLTRKDKRQMKTERRRGGRYLKQLGFLT